MHIKCGENELSGINPGRWPPYPESHPDKVFGIQTISDRSNSLMSTVTTADLNTHPTLSKIQIIMDKDEL